MRTLITAKTVLTYLAPVVLGSLVTGAAACTVSATPLAFGPIDPLADQPTESVGSLTVECPESMAYTLSVTPGKGTYNQRLMSVGELTLAYNLYIDQEHLFIFGDGTGDTRVLTGEGVSIEHGVYGKVPAQPRAYPGHYTDDIVVTVAY
ncbi:Csu type fimbrial protein [Saccharospirillum alexandrii]|uniref:Csu type fimbrial protein n=1 Tax=Saccharospirillum alexandrii TaxID=2448477 RepID=UPI000FD7E7FE|nr:spore coat U domain-containing protein [Saccharospirillum alexandrii]